MKWLFIGIAALTLCACTRADERKVVIASCWNRDAMVVALTSDYYPPEERVQCADIYKKGKPE